ncbi:polysaccharide deacetylase family protein [Clostridium psychrophilum]|uniref:polysaccharide deacetylase family protein n=1 Tax=Clostridium psychrophilum TaxID=132926 RepID=UPI001C0D3859|nr:polysaccharide deacetylase family protein [Clostridium psychrophilum]MBU3180331.1 polysaccharide deacetylase [Clostridium psychrophilum]
MKIEKRKKKIIENKKWIILAMVIMVILSCLIFYIDSKTKDIRSSNVKTELKKSLVKSPKTNINLSYTDVYKHIYRADGNKIAYLTFDDGPSPNNTSLILKILDEYNVKATFFIVGSNAIAYPDLVRKEFADKQSIGNHTYSHNYKYLYSDTRNFITDINKCNIVLKLILGNNFKTKLVRFPGGSFGKKLESFRETLKSDGYNYVDWNDITGDAEGQNISVDKLLDNLKKYTKGKEHVVVLMHDASNKETTVQALPKVIEYLKSQKYSFGKLK